MAPLFRRIRENEEKGSGDNFVKPKAIFIENIHPKLPPPSPSSRPPLREINTNTALPSTAPRPTFKLKIANATTPERKISPIHERIAQLEPDPDGHSPVVFREKRRRIDEEEQPGGLHSPPIKSKKPDQQPSLSMLIKTRALELKTASPDPTSRLDLVPEEWQKWNSHCYMKSNKLLINPRRLPIEQGNASQFTENVYVLNHR